MDLLTLNSETVWSQYIPKMEAAIKEAGLKCWSTLHFETLTTVQPASSGGNRETHRSRPRLAGDLWGIDDQERARVRIHVQTHDDDLGWFEVKVSSYYEDARDFMIGDFSGTDFKIAPNRHGEVKKCFAAIADACKRELREG